MPVSSSRDDRRTSSSSSAAAASFFSSSRDGRRERGNSYDSGRYVDRQDVDYRGRRRSNSVGSSSRSQRHDVCRSSSRSKSPNVERDRPRRRRRAADTVELLKALGQRVRAWRTVRVESRLRLLVGITFLDASIGRYVLPNPEKTKCRWVFLYLVITKPRALNLPKDHFHVTVLPNSGPERSAVASLEVASVEENAPDGPDVLFFGNVCEVEVDPDLVPDPNTEVIYSAPCPPLDPNALAEKCSLPADSRSCVRLSVGAWYHTKHRAIYYLRMEKSLLAICPEGWTCRSLGAVLCKMLDHPSGCATCSRKGAHVDVMNAEWKPGPMADECACLAPCLYRKTAQCELPVRGDGGLCQSLFLADVSSVRVLEDRDGPRITGRLDEIIGSGSGHRFVPVNVTGWHLVRLPPVYTDLMIAGCANLSLALRERFANDSATTGKG